MRVLAAEQEIALARQGGQAHVFGLRPYDRGEFFHRKMSQSPRVPAIQRRTIIHAPLSHRMFYHLQSKTMSPCSLTEAAYAEARSSWLCTGCCSPKPGIGAIDAHVEELEPAEGPLNCVPGCGLPIVLKAFLQELGEDVIQRDLLLGRVYGPNGKQLNEWVTFRGKRKLIIRGSKNVSYRRCSECNRHVYFAMGKRYLYPTPSAEFEIFESDLFGLVVPEHIFERINSSIRRGVYVDKLSSLDAPLDSLGELGDE